MSHWVIIFLGLLLGIPLAALFISLGSKNWAKSYRASLIYVLLSSVVLIFIVSAAAFSMIVLGKEGWPVSAGIIFSLTGLAMVLGAPWLDRRMTILSPPRLQEMTEIFGTAGHGRKSFRVLGLISILIGLPFFIAAPFLRNQDAAILLGWGLLAVINGGAGFAIVMGLITGYSMSESCSKIGEADRDALMSLWPPIVIPVLGPPRTSNWEQFKKRLIFQLDFRFRDVFALFVPQQKAQKIAWLGLLVLFISWFFLHPPRSSGLFNVLKLHKLSVLVSWSIALMVGYWEAKVRRKFMAALQGRVDELDSSESAGRVRHDPGRT